MVNFNLTNSQTNSSSSIATNLVFIDTAVANFSNLLAGLKPNTEAIVLDPTQDGISQITNFLSQRSGIVDSIQILGHGAAGMLQLGSTSLSSENLQQYQSALSTWFSPQTGKTPDLLIYGCDVASGEIGANFIQKLSQITGADVAASGATIIGFQPGSLFASDKPLAVLTGVNAASLTPNSFLVV